MILVWAGPVNFAQVGGARIPGAVEVSFPCTGDGSPSCAAMADALRDSEGRRLPALLASRGLDPTSEVVLAAFSAGGSVVKRLLLHPADRAQVRAVMLSDATYAAPALTEADEGYVLYAAEAATNPSKLLVATASAAANKTHPTGIQVMGMIRERVEALVGEAFVVVEEDLDPPPAVSWELGNALLLEYPDVPHGAQVTELAERVWAKTLLPWLANERSWASTERGLGKRAAGLLAALGGSYLLWRAVRG